MGKLYYRDPSVTKGGMPPPSLPFGCGIFYTVESIRDNTTNEMTEPIEKMWVEECLSFANSTRYASAMAGADYGVFANGRWYLSKNIRGMQEWLDLALQQKKTRK